MIIILLDDRPILKFCMEKVLMYKVGFWVTKKTFWNRSIFKDNKMQFCFVTDIFLGGNEKSPKSFLVKVNKCAFLAFKRRLSKKMHFPSFSDFYESLSLSKLITWGLLSIWWLSKMEKSPFLATEAKIIWTHTRFCANTEVLVEYRQP